MHIGARYDERGARSLRPVSIRPRSVERIGAERPSAGGCGWPRCGHAGPLKRPVIRLSTNTRRLMGDRLGVPVSPLQREVVWHRRSSFDDISGLIPQTPTSTAMNAHGMRGPSVHDDIDLSLVNPFYSDHARVCLRWIGRQGRIFRPCVTLFHHRSV